MNFLNQTEEEDELAPYKEQVIEQIKQKISAGEYSPEKRQAIVDQNTADASGVNWQAGLAALGAGLQGKDAAGAAQGMMANQAAARKGKLDAFDSNRRLALEDRDLARKDQLYADEDAKRAAEKDPNSMESKLARDLAMQMDPKGQYDGLTAEQFKAFSPVMQKKYELAEKSKDRAEQRADRYALYADRKADRATMQADRDALKEQTRQDKLAKEARPSDKQIEAFTDLDNAKSDLENLLATLGDNSGWTGSVDGRMPDFLVGDDQVAWRSAVGKYKDAYRKAITGAGAGPTEIAMLEKRLPSETDTYKNFVAKAQEAEKELSRRKQTLAENLKKGGKDVSQFAGDQMAGKEPAVLPPKASAKLAKVGDVMIKNNVAYKKTEQGWMPLDSKMAGSP